MAERFVGCAQCGMPVDTEDYDAPGDQLEDLRWVCRDKCREKVMREGRDDG